MCATRASGIPVYSVEVAGADADDFQAIAEDQAPTIDVHHGPGYLSRIELPVMPRRPE